MTKSPRLRTLLFIGFTLVSLVPVLLLGTWVTESALQKELDAVEEKHLLIANNATAALSRYVRDAEVVFRLVASSYGRPTQDEAIPGLLESIHLDYVCITDPMGNVLHVFNTDNQHSPSALPLSVLAELEPMLNTSGGGVVFTGVMPGPAGAPSIFMATRIDPEHYAVGSLSTSYLLELQESISFGKLGHAAIVDSSGRVLAHPNAEWRMSMKDISKVEPVKRMMAGETGVSFFYSPAVKKDMVAGFSTVPGVGWGVMILQPVEELEQLARDVGVFVALLALLGVCIAALLAWWLSGYLARPVLAVAETARHFANNEPWQSPALANHTPQELRSLTDSFNSMMRDVSDANANVLEKSNILQATLDNLAEGIVMVDGDDNLVTANHNFTRFFNLPDTMLQPPTPWDAVARHILQQLDGQSALSLHFDPKQLMTEKAGHQELTLKDGRILEQRVNPLPGGGVVASYTDISERRRAEGRVRYLASHDELTNLPNRLTFHTKLNEAIAESKRSGHGGVLIYMDLDQFKDINDTLGHSVGDLVLKAVASRLRECLGENGWIARLGGDEFGFILSPLTDTRQAERLAKSVIETLSRPFRVHTNELYLGVAIGITCFPRDGDAASELLKNADLAMYEAKTHRRNSLKFFDPKMNARVRTRKKLEDDLHRALDREELAIAYQPCFDLSSGKVIGIEALARWEHPVRGNIGPAEFIPIAESTGMIIQLGAWVLNKACLDHGEFIEQFDGDLRLCVNLSALQFTQQDLIATVSSALNESGMAPAHLELELTESTVMHDTETAITTLRELRGLGVTIAIDDFGTGYSSLSQLSRLPLDRIKIDGSFVRNISTASDSNGAAILEAIVSLASSLNIPLVAEGVETREQYDFLVSLACRELQGRYMVGPLTKPELIDWLRRRQNAPLREVLLTEKPVAGGVDNTG